MIAWRKYATITLWSFLFQKVKQASFETLLTSSVEASHFFLLLHPSQEPWLNSWATTSGNKHGHGTGLHCCRRSSTAQCDVSQRDPKDRESPLLLNLCLELPKSWTPPAGMPRAETVLLERGERPWVQMSRVSLQREEETLRKRKGTSWSQELLESWAI